MLVHSPKKMKLAVRTGCLWGVAVLLAGLSACGSSSSKCGTSCKADGSVDDKPVDAPVDHGQGQDMALIEKHDAHADAPADLRMSSDSANACDQSITAACAAGTTHDAGAFSIHCASTWAGTTSTAYFCARPQTTVLTNVCGDYKELIDTNGTSEYIYIYDGAGALYAITHTTGADSHCVAGPGGFSDPVGCSSTSMLFSCSADAGHHG
jgi:hypothetical protein